jgi:hypothetical protein
MNFVWAVVRGTLAGLLQILFLLLINLSGGLHYSDFEIFAWARESSSPISSLAYFVIDMST